MGIIDLFKTKKNPDLNFVFNSPDHLRYENSIHVSGPHGGAPRAVKVVYEIIRRKGNILHYVNNGYINFKCSIKYFIEFE